MKTRINFFNLLLILLMLAKLAHGQAVAPSNLQYTWGPVAATGQVGQYLVFSNINVPRPTNYTIDWSAGGTAPVTCTFRVEGSTDGTNWYGLDATSPATTSCVASNMESIAYRPVLFIRINIVAYTQGDNTTAITFHYTGGGHA